MRSKVDNPGVVNSREMQAEAVPAQPRALWFTPVRVDGVSLTTAAARLSY